MIDPIAGTPLIWLPDVIRFLVAFILVAVVPGYSVARIFLRYGTTMQRLLATVPSAYGLVTIVGLTTSLLHMPFTLQAYAVTSAIVVLAAFWFTRKRCSFTFDRWSFLPWITGLIQVLVVTIGETLYIVPSNVDAPAHSHWIDIIRRTHTYPLALLSSTAGSPTSSFYPPSFHALGALLLEIVPMPTYRIVFYATLIALGLIPFAVYVMTEAVTRSSKTAAIASTAGLACAFSLYNVIGEGLSPFVLSIVIASALACSGCLGFVQHRRESLLLAALLSVTLFYEHPTELLTAGLLSLAMLPSYVSSLRQLQKTLPHLAAIMLVLCISTLPVIVAVHNTIVGGAATEVIGRHLFSSHVEIDPWSIVSQVITYIFGAPIALGIPLISAPIGIAACIRRRQGRALVLIFLSLIAVYVDSQTSNIGSKLYAITFPWALPERISATSYLFVAPLTGIGIVAVADRYVRRLPSLARPLCIILYSVGLIGASVISLRFFDKVTIGDSFVGPRDAGALTWLVRNAGAGTIVLNEGRDLRTQNLAWSAWASDGAAWLPDLGGPIPLFTLRGEGPGNIDSRFSLLTAAGLSKWPRVDNSFAQSIHVRYVFYGSWLPPGAKRHLQLASLFTNPQLHLVFSGVDSCNGPSAFMANDCPANAAYVFSVSY